MTTATTAKTVGSASRPLVRLFAYVSSWFVFSLSFMLLVYSFESVVEVPGSCTSGTAFMIVVRCPQGAGVFLPWVVFSALIAFGVGVAFASGIGFSLRVWAWPILFGVLGATFIAAGGAVGYGIGALFVIMAIVPLLIDLRASAQRVFLGSVALSGRQFTEGENAQPSFSSQTMPNPPHAIKPRPRDWVISVLGFAIPAGAGLVLAGFWVTHLHGA